MNNSQKENDIVNEQKDIEIHNLNMKIKTLNLKIITSKTEMHNLQSQIIENKKKIKENSMKINNLKIKRNQLNKKELEGEGIRVIEHIVNLSDKDATWTISPASSIEDKQVWLSNGQKATIDQQYAVRPTIYLKNRVYVIGSSGDGRTRETAYEIGAGK